MFANTNGKGIFQGMLVICTLAFLFASLLPLTGMRYKLPLSLEEWLSDYPVESMVYIMGMENKYFSSQLNNQNYLPSIGALSLEVATNIKIGDIRSFLGRELPGFSLFDSKIVVAGQGTDYTNLVYESTPPLSVLLQEPEVNQDELIKEPENFDSNSDTNSMPTTGKRNVVYIYHTHSRESFLPHLKNVTNPDLAQSPEVNITMVGKRLGKELEELGIGSTVDYTDIPIKLWNRGWDYNNSYEMSREIVQQAMATDNNLNYFFDIHRDAQPEKFTTTTINGKKYARLFFIVGTGFDHYEKNLQLATELHKMFEEKYPGISRGVIEKSSHQGNGVYNQDLSTKSIIIEIGGVENHLEQMYRTTEAFAEVFSEYYWEAEKVNATN